jgi:RNA polymerase sigma factor (sigma-70 family)
MRSDEDKINLRKLVQKDRHTVERWFNKYCDPLYTFIYYRVDRDGELAAELLQETFAAALERIHKYKPEKGPMFTWLAWQSRTCITKAFKVRKRHLSYDVNPDMLAAIEHIETEALPDKILEKKETAELVQLTLSNLPDDYQLVLREFYYNRKPIKVIAAAHGRTENAIKVSLHRARKAFKEAFLKLTDSFQNPSAADGRIL